MYTEKQGMVGTQRNVFNVKNEFMCGTRTVKGRPKLLFMWKCLLVLWVIFIYLSANRCMFRYLSCMEKAS